MISAHKDKRGFTLVELLASMAIGTIVLLAAASLLGTSGESYERVGGSVATEREARALLTQISSDLSTAVFQADGVIEKSGKSWPTDRLGFLSLQPESAQTENERIGDLCSVYYYVKDIQIGGKQKRCLMRGFRESRDTFDSLKNGQVSTLFTERDRIDEPVAFGVVSFEARPKSLNAAGAWVDWVPNANDGPAAIQVRLVLARRELSGRLKTPADWDGQGTSGSQLGAPADADENRYLEVFSALIRYGNNETS